MCAPHDSLFAASAVPKDHPLPIGYGETISAPHMHATCLELLRSHLAPGARVLDVGSGAGATVLSCPACQQPSGARAWRV